MNIVKNMIQDVVVMVMKFYVKNKEDVNINNQVIETILVYHLEMVNQEVHIAKEVIIEILL